MGLGKPNPSTHLNESQPENNVQLVREGVDLGALLISKLAQPASVA